MSRDIYFFVCLIFLGKSNYILSEKTEKKVNENLLKKIMIGRV